jgi:hypothetical protein
VYFISAEERYVAFVETDHLIRTAPVLFPEMPFWANRRHADRYAVVWPYDELLANAQQIAAFACSCLSTSGCPDICRNIYGVLRLPLYRPTSSQENRS